MTNIAYDHILLWNRPLYFYIHFKKFHVCLGRKSRKLDHRVENLLYRKSKLESTSETSAVLSGFAIVSFYMIFYLFLI
jgi:hypothetical protein